MEVPNKTLRSIRAKFSILKSTLKSYAAELPTDGRNEVNTAVSAVELELHSFDLPPEREYTISPVGEAGWKILVHSGGSWADLDGLVYDSVTDAAAKIPGIELAPVYPNWVQPTGSHDAYAAGTKVTHTGGNWESLIDDNVWEPGAPGSDNLWKGI